MMSYGGDVGTSDSTDSLSQGITPLTDGERNKVYRGVSRIPRPQRQRLETPRRRATSRATGILLKALNRLAPAALAQAAGAAEPLLMSQLSAYGRAPPAYSHCHILPGSLQRAAVCPADPAAAPRMKAPTCRRMVSRKMQPLLRDR